VNPVERLVRRVDRFQRKHAVVGFPFAVMQKYGNDQAGAKAALVAYYGLFAIFPLLLLFTTILGIVLKNDPALQQRIVKSALVDYPVMATLLGCDHNTHAATACGQTTLGGSGIGLVIGIVGTLYGSSGVVQAAQNSLNTVWNVPYVKWPNFYLRRLRGLAAVALLGLAILLSVILSIFATSVASGWLAPVLAFVGATAVMLGVFLLSFMLFTAEKLGWRDVLLGAVAAALFWQVLQLIGGWYVGRELRHSSATYGTFGTVIVLLSWVFLGAQTTLYAAEINVVHRFRLWPRSMVQPPLTDADKATLERLARMEVRRPEVSVDVSFSDIADWDPLKGPAPSPDSPPAPPRQDPADGPPSQPSTEPRPPPSDGPRSETSVDDHGSADSDHVADVKIPPS
jgi:YihY family inner membrane protein